MSPTIACVGHNTVDKYLHQGMMYPGGNEVNVAALSARNGTSSSYIGCVGNDVYGKLIVDALREEGVDLSHCHIMDDVNNYTEISLNQGERIFGKLRRGASSKCEITSEDIEYILSHQLLHTGFYSRMENFLVEYHDQITISFDFTEYADEAYLKKYLPLVDLAFISTQSDKHSHEVIENRLAKYYNMGPEVVVMTMGKQGSYLYNGILYLQPAIHLEEVVDTLGAGDSFISKFLIEYLRDTPPTQSLHLATQSATETCRYFGAFGHGIPIPV